MAPVLRGSSGEHPDRRLPPARAEARRHFSKEKHAVRKEIAGSPRTIATSAGGLNMNGGVRAAASALGLAAARFVIPTGAAGPAQSGAVQLQLGNEFLAEGRYDDALGAFKK